MKLFLFDLDGTLLPMDQEAFLGAYFKLLAETFAPRGYEPKALIDAVWKGTAAMVANDGTRSNEEAFWACFGDRFGHDRVAADRPLFDAFYRTRFQEAAAVCQPTPKAAQAVALLREKGVPVALATNPVFPAVATYSRIRWAGLHAEDFAWITTYENTGYCKPNPAYYQDLLARLGVAPEDAVMIGNDVEEDMVAAQLGMQVYLLTDCCINKSGAEIDQFPHGDFDALLDWLRTV